MEIPEGFPSFQHYKANAQPRETLPPIFIGESYKKGESHMPTVYVLNKNGKPLMPTTRCGHVRILLKTKKARVVKKLAKI